MLLSPDRSGKGYRDKVPDEASARDDGGHRGDDRKKAKVKDRLGTKRELVMEVFNMDSSIGLLLVNT